MNIDENTELTSCNRAQQFLYNTNTTIRWKLLGYYPFFNDDKEKRLVFQFTIARGTRSYTSTFGQSTFESERQLVRDKTINPRSVAYKEALEQAARKIETAALHSDPIPYLVYPTAYDLLSCLQQHDPGTFEDFCSEYGYDTDSRKAEKTYNACREQYLGLAALYNNEEMQQLQEIDQ